MFVLGGLIELCLHNVFVRIYIYENKYRETCGGGVVVVGEPNTLATDGVRPILFYDIDKHTHTRIYLYFIIPAH